MVETFQSTCRLQVANIYMARIGNKCSDVERKNDKSLAIDKEPLRHFKGANG